MNKSWKESVLKHLGLDVDVSLLESIDFLMEQINFLLKVLDRNKVSLSFNNEDRRKLAELAVALDPNKREMYSRLVTPETLLVWHRKLIGKLINSKKGKRNGAPPITDEERQKIIEIAITDMDWGLLRICGELKKIGYERCPMTVAKVLREAGIEPPPLKSWPKGTWKRFMDAHKEVWQVDFAYYDTLNLFDNKVTRQFIQLYININTREVVLGGITSHPHEQWMMNKARSISGFEMENADMLIRDNDKIYQDSYDATFESHGTKVRTTSIGAPNMNAYIERFIGSLQRECLDHLVLFSKRQLQYAVSEYIEFYNTQRPHQGIDNEIPKPKDHDPDNTTGKVICHKRLGGLLNSFERVAA